MVGHTSLGLDRRWSRPTIRPAVRAPGRPFVGSLSLAIGGALALSACSAAASPDPTAIKGKFDVGGRSLYLECSGSGSPTVVMDSGLGDTHTVWSTVVAAVSRLSRTCTYDRANLGASDAAPKPRSSADVVADLHALLQAAAIPDKS